MTELGSGLERGEPSGRGGRGERFHRSSFFGWSGRFQSAPRPNLALLSPGLCQGRP